MWQRHFLWIIFVISLLVVPAAAFAQYTSPSYKVEETFFGTGGDLDLNSANYKAQVAAGALAVGTFSSANFDANAGFLTQNVVFLEMTTSGGSLDLGILTDTAASTGAIQAGGCSCSFSVRTYLSDAYAVYTMSQPPTNESGAVLDAKTVLGVPSVSTSVEEFGINLVANASPAIGANPVNQPDNTFADGVANTGYSTPNQFKYNPGDVIAHSAATGTNPAIGQTDYTISYIAKAKTFTEAGLYILRHDLVATGTF